MTAQLRQQSGLASLELLLLRLAETVDRAMIGAQHVLRTQDRDEAARVLESDRIVDQLRAELEIEAHRLLAQPPPLLGEALRAATAALVLAVELRHIGDCACEIVTIALASAPSGGMSAAAECIQMAHRAREMLQGTMRAIMTRDASAVARLRAADDQMDALYECVRQAVLLTMRTQAELSETAAGLLWIAHNLDQMAECAVRIAERAAFITTGSWSTPDARNTVHPTTTPGIAQDAR